MASVPTKTRTTTVRASAEPTPIRLRTFACMAACAGIATLVHLNPDAVAPIAVGLGAYPCRQQVDWFLRPTVLSAPPATLAGPTSFRDRLLTPSELGCLAPSTPPHSATRPSDP